MDCNVPGSSFQGIFQARILEWVAISFPEACLFEGSLCSEGVFRAGPHPCWQQLIRGELLGAVHSRARGSCSPGARRRGRGGCRPLRSAEEGPDDRRARWPGSCSVCGAFVGPLGWAWSGGGALLCVTSAHLAGHMVPAAGACAFVSLSACCWRSDFCWGTAHPFGPGSARPTVGREPMADSSPFRPGGSQCTWARRSRQPESCGGGGGD